PRAHAAPAAAGGSGVTIDWPAWAGPVSHFILHTGLPLTAKIAAASVVGATVLGIVLGTLLTIDFLPTRALIRLYIEVWRGLPQALRRLLPPLVSLLVNVIQNTTIVALIGGLELLGAAQSQVNRLSGPPPAGIVEIHAFEIFGGVMLLFFAISFPLTRLAAYL